MLMRGSMQKLLTSWRGDTPSGPAEMDQVFACWGKDVCKLHVGKRGVDTKNVPTFAPLFMSFLAKEGFDGCEITDGFNRPDGSPFHPEIAIQHKGSNYKVIGVFWVFGLVGSANRSHQLSIKRRLNMAQQTMCKFCPKKLETSILHWSNNCRINSCWFMM